MNRKITKRMASLGLSAAIVAGILVGGVTPYSQSTSNDNGFATVVEAKSKISLNKTKLTLTVGEKATLKVKGTTAKVKWTSKKPKVAVVSTKGVVKAKAAGKTIITAKVEKKTLKCSVSVKAAPLSINWNSDSVNAESIRQYVKTVTDSSNKSSYIPVEDRIAVFDMDGTLMCETYPTYYDTTMFVNYCLYDHPERVDAEVKAVAEFCEGKSGSEVDKVYPTEVLGGYFAKAYAGLTVQELYDYAVEFGKKDTGYFDNMKYSEGFYLPMVEVVKYLYENDFTIYVVSGTERTAVRAIIDNSPLKNYVKPNNIIGTVFEVKVKGHENDAEDSKYQYTIGDDLVITGNFLKKDVKASKVILIQREIGKQPVLAFGNSSGDNSMCYYTLDDNKYPSEAYMLVADDATRERGKESAWETKNNDYAGTDINLVSMKNEFKRIYADGVMPAK